MFSITHLVTTVGEGVNRAAGRVRRARYRPSAELLEPRSLMTSIISASGKTLSVKYDKSFDATIATFTSNLAKPSAKDFQATVAWGDGTTSTGKIAKQGGKFVVDAKHKYLDPLTQESVVTSITETTAGAIAAAGVSATAGASATATSTVKVIGAAITNEAVNIVVPVGNINQAPVVLAKFAVAAIPGAPPPTSAKATIMWDSSGSAASTDVGTIVPDPSGANGLYDVLGTPDYKKTSNDSNAQDIAAGLLPPPAVMVSVTINLGHKTGSVSFTIPSPLMVTAVPLVQAAAYPAPQMQTATIGDNQDFYLAAFTDQNFWATGNTTNDYTIEVDWGDYQTISTQGNYATSDAPLNLSFFLDKTDPAVVGYFSLGGHHTYAEQGPYTISVTITNQNGGTVYETTDRIIVTSDVMLEMIDPQYAFAGSHPPLPPDWESQIGYFDGAPGATLSQYLFTINWGDGQTSTEPDFYDELSDSAQLIDDHAYAVGNDDPPLKYTITVSVAGPGINPSQPLTVTDTIFVYEDGEYL